MTPSTALLTLYTSILLLSLNGLFSNGLPLDTVTMTSIRSLFAALALAIFIVVIRRRLVLPNIKTTFIVYGLGILMGLHWLTYFYAMQSASVAIGMLTLYTYPMMTIFIEPLFTKKKIAKADIVLGIVVFIGLIIIVSDHLSSPNNPVFIGALCGVISALAFALRNTLQKYHCPLVASETLMLHQVIIIGVVLAGFVDLKALTALHTIHWFYLLLLGIFTTALAHTLLVKSYKNFAAKTVAMVSCLQPVFGSLFAWWILNESLSLHTMIGGGIILSVAIYESAQAST
jgi:drug/metabolite transporter (DMT)-like permease